MVPGLGYALVADLSAPGTLYLGSEPGLRRSIDGGVTWSEPSLSYPVLALAATRLTGSTVWAGTTDGGTFTSDDAGVHWTAVNQGLVATVIRALAVDPKRPHVVYAAMSTGVFRSADGGVTWSAAAALTNVSALAVDGSQPATVYAGTFNFRAFNKPGNFGAIHRSDDAGATWQLISPRSRSVASPPSRSTRPIQRRSTQPPTPAFPGRSTGASHGRRRTSSCASSPSIRCLRMSSMPAAASMPTHRSCTRAATPACPGRCCRSRWGREVSRRSRSIRSCPRPSTSAARMALARASTEASHGRRPLPA